MPEWVSNRWRRLVAEQSGFTLVELLVSISLLGFVMTATLAVLSSGAQTAARDNERTLAVREAQTGLNRIIHDFRQATAIDSATANRVRIHVQTATTSAATAFQDTYVEYDCGTTASGDCVRYQWLVSAGATRPASGTTVATDVLNAGTSVGARQIFTVDAAAGTGTVRLEVPAAGGRACAASSTSCREFRSSVVLDDGFFARNLQTS
jgi:prepilin-type N-terminal cleavage/methylation domain-containing protein